MFRETLAVPYQLPKELVQADNRGQRLVECVSAAERGCPQARQSVMDSTAHGVVLRAREDAGAA